MQTAPAPPPVRPSLPALLFSLLANLVPIAGVVWLGWSAIQLLFLFWVESFVIGAFTFQRIRMAQGDHDGVRMKGMESDEAFFVMHYGGFWSVHGLLLIVFTAAFPALGGLTVLRREIVGSPDFWLAVAAMTISYAMAFWSGWIRPRAWRFATRGRELFRPYGRLIAMHLVMSLGLGVMMSSGGGGLVAILILCIVKAVFDLIFEATLGGVAAERPSA